MLYGSRNCTFHSFCKHRRVKTSDILFTVCGEWSCVVLYGCETSENPMHCSTVMCINTINGQNTNGSFLWL